MITCNVFVYGTLLNDSIRFDVLGYHTTVIPASLAGYKMSSILLGNESFLVIEKDSSGQNRIEGAYFSMRKSDLYKLDHYETEAYSRIDVRLDNNTQAWVYIRNLNSE